MADLATLVADPAFNETINELVSSSTTEISTVGIVSESQAHSAAQSCAPRSSLLTSVSRVLLLFHISTTF